MIYFFSQLERKREKEIKGIHQRACNSIYDIGLTYILRVGRIEDLLSGVEHILQFI